MRFGELTHGGVALRQPGQDGSACRIGECRKRGVEPFGSLNHAVNDNWGVQPRSTEASEMATVRLGRNSSGDDEYVLKGTRRGGPPARSTERRVDSGGDAHAKGGDSGRGGR